MKILVVSDIHGDVESLLPLLEKAPSFDVLVCPGDLTDLTQPKGFTQEDVARIVLEELRSFGKPLFVVPGNMDGPLLPLLEEEKTNLHGKGVVYEDVGFYGFGGAKSPIGTTFEPSEEEIWEGLEKGYQQVRESRIKVQVTHAPPFNTSLDRISSGLHVGSQSVSKFIRERRPAVAISAHIHEARGLDQLGETKLLNAGKFSEGYCGLVRIEKEKVETEIVNLV